VVVVRVPWSVIRVPWSVFRGCVPWRSCWDFAGESRRWSGVVDAARKKM